MPLVRYELRNELGLANPQLYRTAGKDDSQALLAGVAMAGLVGIIRQLGDLAEYVVHYSLEHFNFFCPRFPVCHLLSYVVVSLTWV
jgi:hypothetical protein